MRAQEEISGVAFSLDGLVFRNSILNVAHEGAALALLRPGVLTLLTRWAQAQAARPGCSPQDAVRTVRGSGPQPLPLIG